MKRFVYIVAVALMMGIVSCSKETIRPLAQDAEVVPVWRTTGSADNSGDEGTPEGGYNEEGTSEGDSGEGGTPEGGGITDPNDDQDGNRKRKP